MCHVGTKSARPFIAPSSEPQWGLTLIEPLHPYIHGSIRRGRSDGKKLSVPSTSPTPAARCGAPSTNLLAGPDRGHPRGGQGRALTPCIFNFFYFSIAFLAKKGRFLSFEKEKWKIHHFWTPPWKNVDAFRWKNPLMGPHLETIPPTAMVWTLVISVPRFSKMHRFTTREELGTQEEEVRVHKARLQEGVRHMEGRNTWRR